MNLNDDLSHDLTFFTTSELLIFAAQNIGHGWRIAIEAGKVAGVDGNEPGCTVILFDSVRCPAKVAYPKTNDDVREAIVAAIDEYRKRFPGEAMVAR